MPIYTVFVGFKDENDIAPTLDRKGLSWDAAQQVLADHFKSYANDSCDHCQADAHEALQRLSDAEPGRFEAELDGFDCLIEVTP